MLEVGEVARDRAGEPFGTADQFLGRDEHGAAAFLDLGDRRADLRQDVSERAGNGLGAGADMIDVDRLMVENAGELPVGFAHGGHARRHRFDRGHGVADRVLDVADQRADLAGGLGGLLRQRLHLVGDDREAAAGGAGARSLDGGVERKQRRLRGDALDQLDDGADTIGRCREAAHRAVGAGKLVDRAVGRGFRGGDFAAGARDQIEQRPRGVGHGADVACGALRGIGRIGRA